MKGRNQDSFSVLGNSIKVFGLAILFFVVKYIFMGLVVVLALFGFCFLIKEIFQSK